MDERSDRQIAISWRQAVAHAVFALVVGVVTAFASILLCICVDWSYGLFQIAPWAVWLLPVAGILELLLYKALKLPDDLTTHHVIERIRAEKPVSLLLAPGILIATCMSIACGGSVGKEAGALQMGSSLGTLVNKAFKLRSVSVRHADESMDGYVASCGMAACFAALFFAPLGACMFVIELVRFDRTVLRHSASIFLGCVVAFFISSAIGVGDVIDKVAVPVLDWRVVGQISVVGLAGALAGTIFSGGLRGIHSLTKRVTKNLYVWVAIGGIAFAVFVTLFGWDRFTGTGADILNASLHGEFGPWDFAVKMLLTLLCLAFWFKGGEIMPSFCIGALLGASCTYMTGGDPSFGAAVGVMCFFAAFSRCPLAAFLMGCEIFGWAMAPHLGLGITIAYVCGSPTGYYGLLKVAINKVRKTPKD